MSLSALKNCVGGIKQLLGNFSYGKKCGEICNIMENSPSKLKRFGNITKSVFISGVQPVAHTIVKDITNSRFVVRDTKKAYNAAKLLAETNNAGKAKKAIEVGSAVVNNGVKPHLPGLMGVAFGFVPIPFIQPVGYVLGKVIQIIC